MVSISQGSQSPLAGGTAKATRRNLREPYRTLVRVMCIACALYVIVSGLRGTIFPYLHRASFLGLILPIIYLTYPTRKTAHVQDRPTLFDIVLSLAVIGAVIAAWVSIDRILWRIPFVARIYPADIIMGVIMVFGIFEACRRVLGWPLITVGLTFLAYGLWGRNLPGILAHGGVSQARLIEFLILGSDGVFSSITGIGATYLFTFMTFGTLLVISGVGDMVFNIARALMSNSVGAPAKIAVLSSAFMAMISGSTLANVVTTGSVTIPMMKKAGFRDYEAAAFETAASVGGQITPPIMGAGIFIMAEITGYPLVEILKLSILPALLYYIAVYVFVYNRISLRHLTGEIRVDKSQQLPSVFQELRKRGAMLVPVVVLVALMVRGYSPYLSSCLAIVLSLVLLCLSRATRMGVRDLLDWLHKSTLNALTVSAILATAAVVVGVIFQTGFVVIASSAVISLSKGILWVCVLLTILMSYVVGMALPITASYILIAIMGVPAFVYMGVPVLAAHLAIFWFSQDSTITPPVCMTAFVAADIAEAPRWKTAFTTLMFAKGLYIVPFLFLYTDLLGPSLPERLVDAGIIALGLVTVAVAFDGFWKQPITIGARLVALAAGACLLYSATYAVLTGAGLPFLLPGLVLWVITVFHDRIPLIRPYFVGQRARV